MNEEDSLRVSGYQQKITQGSFTELHRTLLTKLVLPHKQTLLDSGYSSQVTEAKANAWTQITEEFNRATDTNRSTKRLQSLWLEIKSKKMQSYQNPVSVIKKTDDSIDYDDDNEFDDSDNMSVASDDFDMPAPALTPRKRPKAPIARKKERREANYTLPERKLLHRLIDRYKSVVLPVHTNTEFIRLKQAAWKRITREFNDTNSSMQRSQKSLWACSRTLIKAKGEFAFMPHTEHEYLETKRILERDMAEDTPDTSADKSECVKPPADREKRQPNFTPQERQLLFRIMDRYKSVILRRNNNIETKRLKKLAWEQVTKEYNDAQVGQTERTEKNLWTCSRSMMKMTDEHYEFDAPGPKEYANTKRILEAGAKAAETSEEPRHASDDDEKSATSRAKTRRNPNFSIPEKKLIVRLARAYAKIVEDKSTSSTAVFKKRSAWAKITEHFNKLSPAHITRSTKELIAAWRGFKTDVKRRQRRLPPHSRSNDTQLDAILETPETSAYNDVAAPSPDFLGHFLAADSPPMSAKEIMSAFPTPVATKPKPEVAKTTSSTPAIILNDCISTGSVPASMTSFLHDEFLTGADPLIQEGRSLVHTPVILAKWDKLLDASIRFNKTRLEIMRENAQVQQERDQETYDYRKTLSDKLFRQVSEQDDAIHELKIANLQYDLQLLGKEFT